MIILLLIASILALAYLSFIIYKRKNIPNSISATVYDLDKKYQWCWSAWLSIIGLLLFAPLVDATEEFGWLTIVCLIGCALTPLINSELEKWHTILGVLSGIISQICVLFINYYFLLVWIIFILIKGNSLIRPNSHISKHVNNKYVFISEVICVISTIGALFTYFL